MSKKLKTIIWIVGSILVVSLPVVYKKAEIPQDTVNSILAFVMGMVSQMGIHKVSQARKKKVEVAQPISPVQAPNEPQ